MQPIEYASKPPQKFELAEKYFIHLGKDIFCGRVVSQLGPETYCIEPIKLDGKRDRKITIDCHRMNGWLWYESEEEWKEFRGYFECEYLNAAYQEQQYLEAIRSGVPVITMRDEVDTEE